MSEIMQNLVVLSSIGSLARKIYKSDDLIDNIYVKSTWSFSRALNVSNLAEIRFMGQWWHFIFGKPKRTNRSESCSNRHIKMFRPESKRKLFLTFIPFLFTGAYDFSET